MPQADIGMIGLGVMGLNLALNLADHDFTVAACDCDPARRAELAALAPDSGKIIAAATYPELIACLAPPRRLWLMIPDGAAVDDCLAQLTPLLAPGDLIIDGGNSFYRDTNRRTRALADQGILFLGLGISGGATGARQGPSIMAGGNPAAWPLAEELLRAIAGRVEGEPCCAWLGEEGAGHFVKMVHNGIEYALMEIIAEVYDCLRRGLDLSPSAIAAIFRDWNRGPLNSYLLEISAAILEKREADGVPLIDRILDTAGQKGTGRWSVIAALELDVPLTMTAAALMARELANRRDERGRAAQLLSGPMPPPPALPDPTRFLAQLHDSLAAGQLIAHAQGQMLIQAAAARFAWPLAYQTLSRIWQGGCIIRGALLSRLTRALNTAPDQSNLLLTAYGRQTLADTEAGWRETIRQALALGLPVPALAAGLTFYDGYRAERLPASLIQAQRDYFGGHGYERTDHPPDNLFYTAWPPIGLQD